MLSNENPNAADNGTTVGAGGDTNAFTISDDSDKHNTFDGIELGGPSDNRNMEDSVASSGGDQLPSVEEYKATVGNTRSPVDPRKRFRSYAILGVSLIVIFAILIGSLVGKNNNNNDSTPDNSSSESLGNSDNSVDDEFTPPYNDATTSPFDQAIAVIKYGQYSSSESLVFNATDKTMKSWPPQVRAAHWLAEEDPRIEMQPSMNFIDRYVLAVLYYMTDGPNNWELGPASMNGWTDDFYFLSALDVCKWNKPYAPEQGGEELIVGVICNTDNEIERIWMPDNNMYGRLPAELKLLKRLKEINFYNNKLFGNIPEEYVQLQSLDSLILYQNQLQDAFPTWLGDIPQLEIVNLGKNDIYGTLPDSIQRIERLQVLNCDSCLLVGGINSALMDARKLQALHLGNNRLNGTISDEVFNTWVEIMELDMNSNQFTGNLPVGLLATHPNLMIIDLHDNDFTGPIIAESYEEDPSTIFALSNLRLLSLSGNALNGKIEKWIGELKELRHLDLSFNKLSGSIPTEIGQLKELRYLFLAMNPNYTPGLIPTEIGLLTQLMDTSFQASSRTGPIPAQIGELNSLVLLDLSNNTLTGTIPLLFGNLSSINFLLLADNQLNGTIPDNLVTGGLDTLTLNGENNSFTTVPEMICLSNDKVRTVNVDFVKLTAVAQEYCRCCSVCDGVNRTACDQFFFGNMDPSSEYNYVRSFYQLHEGDKLIPVADMSFNDMPMIGNYSDPELVDEMEFLANHMKIFGSRPNASNPLDGLSNAWEEYAQDNNFTDDYLEKYIEKYLDDQDFDDKYFDDKYLNDDKYLENLNGDPTQKYDDSMYGDYFEDGQLIAKNGDDEFVDVMDPMIDWVADDNV